MSDQTKKSISPLYDYLAEKQEYTAIAIIKSCVYSCKQVKIYFSQFPGTQVVAAVTNAQHLIQACCLAAGLVTATQPRHEVRDALEREFRQREDLFASEGRTGTIMMNSIEEILAQWDATWSEESKEVTSTIEA